MGSAISLAPFTNERPEGMIDRINRPAAEPHPAALRAALEAGWRRNRLGDRPESADDAAIVAALGCFFPDRNAFVADHLAMLRRDPLSAATRLCMYGMMRPQVFCGEDDVPVDWCELHEIHHLLGENAFSRTDAVNAVGAMILRDNPTGSSRVLP